MINPRAIDPRDLVQATTPNFFDIIADGKEPKYGEFGASVVIPNDENFLGYGVRQLENKIVHDAILPALRRPIYIKTRFNASNFGDMYYGTSDSIQLAVKISIEPVEEKPIVYRYVTTRLEIPRDVYKCEHCQGHTKNDMRGHCAACGAPRNDDYLEKS